MRRLPAVTKVLPSGWPVNPAGTHDAVPCCAVAYAAASKTGRTRSLPQDGLRHQPRHERVERRRWPNHRLPVPNFADPILPPAAVPCRSHRRSHPPLRDTLRKSAGRQCGPSPDPRHLANSQVAPPCQMGHMTFRSMRTGGQSDKDAALVVRTRDADPDAELLTAAVAGDRNAFAALLDRHYDRMHSLAWRLTRVRSDAEDVTQEVCCIVAGRVAEFRGEASFATWLCSIVVNACRDLQRRRRSLRGMTERLTVVMGLARGPDGRDLA